MHSRLYLARRFAFLILPVALAAGALPGQSARAMQQDLLKVAQADVGGFSEAQLEAYANAVRKVQAVDDAWQPRINQAESEEAAEVLTTQATDEMIGEIQDEGLSVQEYNAITQAAESDDRLYERIMTLLAQAK